MCIQAHTGKAGDDKTGGATIAIKIERNKRIELCLERQPRIYVLSTIDSGGNRMATNKEKIQSASLSKCGKTLPYKRKNRTFTAVYAVGIQK